MIFNAAMLLTALPRSWKLWLGIGALIALVGGFLVIRHQIYQEGFRAAQEACEREKEAQRQANEAAIRKAEKDLFEAADKLSIRNMEIEDALSRLRQEALADPGGSAACLGIDSVRRLNAIQ